MSTMGMDSVSGQPAKVATETAANKLAFRALTTVSSIPLKVLVDGPARAGLIGRDVDLDAATAFMTGWRRFRNANPAGGRSGRRGPANGREKKNPLGKRVLA
jgi:hypothetical protein